MVVLDSQPVEKIGRGSGGPGGLVMKPVSKVLVVVLDNLGDTVMATSVLRPIKRALPGVRVGMFVKRYAVDLLSDHSLIDRVHAADPFWDGSPGRPAGGVVGYVRTLMEIRRERYDVALVLNTEWRRALSLIVAGVPRRIGYNRRDASHFLTEGLDVSGWLPHFIDDHRRLVEALAPGAAAEEYFPRLDVSHEDVTWLNGWLREQEWAGGDYMAIHPFSGDNKKNWPIERWKILVDRLERKAAARVVILCSASEFDRLGDWPKTTDERVRFLSGTPLRQVKAVLSRARLLIGGDSGPGHLAAALGTPVLSLFGQGDPARSGPVGRGAVDIIHKGPLDQLSVDAVEDAALALLARVPAPGGA
jgi:heptosyltransferase-1